MVTYTNKKGKEVKLVVTRHAYSQFVERYPKAFPDREELQRGDIETIFSSMFAKAHQVKNLSKWEKTRMKRHGKDSMFFRTNGLTFVVQNAIIRTVEISDKNKRHLNKR